MVVGDQAGNVYAYNLATGAAAVALRHRRPGHIDAVGGPDHPRQPARLGLRGHRQRRTPTSGGYQAISPSGGDQWFTQETNPPTDTSAAHNGVQASMAVGDLQGGTDVVAGSLGEEEDALTAGSGGVLNGFPWYQADSNFTTPALADLYGTGATEIVEGGDSSAGISYDNDLRQRRPPARALGHGQRRPAPAQRRPRLPVHNRRDRASPRRPWASSSAPPPRWGSSSAPAPPSTGPTTTTSRRSTPTATSCGRARSTASTSSSPALADVLGNGQLQVVEGTDNGTSGSVYAMNGQNGAVALAGQRGPGDRLGGHRRPRPGVPGRPGPDRERRGGRSTGSTGAVLTTLQPDTGFQNSATGHRRPQRHHRHHPRRLPGVGQLRLPLRGGGVERLAGRRGRRLAAVPPRPLAERRRRHRPERAGRLRRPGRAPRRLRPLGL